MPTTAALEMPQPVSIFAKDKKATRKNKPPPSSAYNKSIYAKNAAFNANFTLNKNRTQKNKTAKNKNSAEYTVAQNLVIAWMEAETANPGSEKAVVLLQQIWDTPIAFKILTEVVKEEEERRKGKK